MISTMYRTRCGRINIGGRRFLLLRLEILGQRIHRLPSYRFLAAPIDAHGLPAARRPHGNLFPFTKQMEQQILSASGLVEIQALMQITKSRNSWNIPTRLAKLSHSWTPPRWRQIHLTFLSPGYSLVLIVRQIFHLLPERFSPNLSTLLASSLFLLLFLLLQRGEHISSAIRLRVFLKITITMKSRPVQFPVPRYARQFFRNLVALGRALPSNQTVAPRADTVPLILIFNLLHLINLVLRWGLHLVHARSHRYGSEAFG